MDDDLFNLIVQIDVIHNSAITAVEVLNSSRMALTGKLNVHEAQGNKLSGYYTEEQILAARPFMIEVNSLYEAIHTNTERDVRESSDALERLNVLLREKLGLKYKIESKVQPADDSSSGESSSPP